MFKLLVVVLAIIAGFVIIQQLPDIQRYLRMRAM